MITDEIFKKIGEATGGTFNCPGSSTTLLGWIPMFDAEGRPLNADPNIVKGLLRLMASCIVLEKVAGRFIYRSWTKKPSKEWERK